MQMYRTSIVNAAIPMPNASAESADSGSTPADGDRGIRGPIPALDRCLGSTRRLAVLLLALSAVAGCEPAVDTQAGAVAAEIVDAGAFSGLALWDDGLAELCYYDAVDEIYGTPRRYTRIMLANREWLNPKQMVKAESPSAADYNAIPVFKTNIIEEIPTENYNYRFMVTIFLGRPDLRFQKLAASSQEWCGTTFKRLVRRPDGLQLDTSSYFENEADRHSVLDSSSSVYPREALFLLAREVASTGSPMDLQVLPRFRSSHAVEPQPMSCVMSRLPAVRVIHVPFGDVRVQTVTLADVSGVRIASYDVEAAAPYRVVTHDHRDGLQLQLRFTERRAYWDRSSQSRFYNREKAP